MGKRRETVFILRQTDNGSPEGKFISKFVYLVFLNRASFLSFFILTSPDIVLRDLY